VTLHPFALSIQVNEVDSGDPPKAVTKAEIRQGDARLGGPGTDSRQRRRRTIPADRVAARGVRAPTTTP